MNIGSENPILLISLQVGFFTLIGFPFSLYMAGGKQRGTDIGGYAAAPIMGIIFSLWVSVLSFTFGWNQGTAGMVLLVVALLTTFFLLIFWRNKFQESSRKSLAARGFAVIFIIAFMTLYFHTSDLGTIGLKSYFPRTNADTFNYLGQIDQLRREKVMSPQMKYPAGYSPAYLHSVHRRGAVTALVAGQAELFDLETHVAFFSILRASLPLTAIGIFSLLLILDSGIFFPFAGVVLFAGGNFMLHQILQQFLSSSLGVVCTIGVLIVASLAIKKGYPPASCLLVGFTTGVLALASPEAHFFILASLGLFFLALQTSVSNKLPVHSLRIVLFFVLGFLLGTFLLLPELYIDLVRESKGTVVGHPGDWVAQTGYIIQASGIALYKGAPFSSYGIAQKIAAVCLLTTTMIGLFFLFFSHWLFSAQRKNVKDMVMLLAVIATIPLAAGGYFYFAGKGYSMLKTVDYFNFIPAVVIGFSLSQARFLFPISHPIKKLTFIFFCILGIGGYLAAALPAKQALFREYIHNIRSGPELKAYSYEIKNGLRGILVDLQGFPLNLFLYVNRWRPVPLYFEAEARYNHPSGIERKVTHVFRMGHQNIPDAAFIDINRPCLASQPVMAELLDARGYLLIVPRGGWLPTEGEEPEALFRWLCGAGSFRVLELDQLQEAKLHVHLFPGPDLQPGNQIEILLGNHLLTRLDPAQLPLELNLRLPKVKTRDEMRGEIRVTGPAGGRRQISVARLYVQEG